MRGGYRRRRLPRPHDMVYVAVKPECRCVVDAVAVQFMARSRLRRAVDGWFARGLLIGRLHAREAVVRLSKCEHGPAQPDASQLSLV